MHKKPCRILISVGEASGDLHASNLIRAVKKLKPTTKFYGMGGDLMKKSGAEIIVNAKDLSIVGLVEIATKFFTILRAMRTLKKALFQDKPDLLILVDYPGFNLRLAKIAKDAGVKVLYYISPKIWAWNQKRIYKIKKYVDKMAVIFPFEVNFYKKWNMPVTFVGNPLLDTVKPKYTRAHAKKIFNLDPKQKIIGLVPGSRRSEIKRMLPIILGAAKILQQHDSKLQFILPLASSLTLEELKPHLAKSNLKIKIIGNNTYDAINICDAVIATSGTVTLEIALLATPLVVIYKGAWIEYQIAKRAVKIPHIGLCNILPNKEVAKELLQYDATPEKIATEIEKILDNKKYRQNMIAELKNIRKSLVGTSKKNLAKLVTSFIALSRDRLTSKRR